MSEVSRTPEGARNAFAAAWQIVTCGRCGRRYQCRPNDDFNSCAKCHAFPANAPDDGLCDACLLAHHEETHGGPIRLCSECRRFHRESEPCQSLGTATMEDVA